MKTPRRMAVRFRSPRACALLGSGLLVLAGCQAPRAVAPLPVEPAPTTVPDQTTAAPLAQGVARNARVVSANGRFQLQAVDTEGHFATVLSTARPVRFASVVEGRYLLYLQAPPPDVDGRPRPVQLVVQVLSTGARRFAPTDYFRKGCVEELTAIERDATGRAASEDRISPPCMQRYLDAALNEDLAAAQALLYARSYSDALVAFTRLAERPTGQTSFPVRQGVGLARFFLRDYLGAAQAFGVAAQVAPNAASAAAALRAQRDALIDGGRPNLWHEALTRYRTGPRGYSLPGLTDAPAGDAASLTADSRFAWMPPLTYPALSKRLGESGKVALAVRIDEDGTPIDVRVAAGSGYERLDAAAIQALQHTQFFPTRVQGRRQASTYQAPMNFVLKDGVAGIPALREVTP